MILTVQHGAPLSFQPLPTTSHPLTPAGPTGNLHSSLHPSPNACHPKGQWSWTHRDNTFNHAYALDILTNERISSLRTMCRPWPSIEPVDLSMCFFVCLQGLLESLHNFLVGDYSGMSGKVPKCEIFCWEIIRATKMHNTVIDYEFDL